MILVLKSLLFVSFANDPIELLKKIEDIDLKIYLPKTEKDFIGCQFTSKTKDTLLVNTYNLDSIKISCDLVYMLNGKKVKSSPMGGFGRGMELDRVKEYNKEVKKDEILYSRTGTRLLAELLLNLLPKVEDPAIEVKSLTITMTFYGVLIPEKEANPHMLGITSELIINQKELEALTRVLFKKYEKRYGQKK